ncbi:RecA recombinase Rhp51 [Pestalotiopsis sp. IQ-011]
MASRDPLYLHKETRLNLEPSSPALVVDLKLSAGGSRGTKRPNGGDEPDKLFRQKNCATASSIYHRQHHAEPKSFLWRILDGNTVLSIRCIDVCKTKKAPDASLVLNLRFSQPIRPSCVVLSDPRDHDALSVFVIDESNQLYTIVLKPEQFRKRSTTEIADACRTQTIQALGFKAPHCMVAADDNLLVVTTHDGGIIRLDRSRTHDVSHHSWKETQFGSKGWGQSFRGFLKGSHTVRYGNVDMDLNAAASAATTDLGQYDSSFLLTVCLDHRLRIWNLQNGHIFHTQDILQAERNPQEIGKWTIDPSQNNLVRIIGEAEGKRTCVTYSPVGAGEFKFWTLQTDAAEGGMAVQSKFNASQLIPPPPPGSDVWTLADFTVAEEGNRTQLWVLWKNNMTYRVQHVSFVGELIDEAWLENWTGVYAGNSPPAAQTSGPCDPTDPAEKWLQLILHPGRFTNATLETALTMYEQGLGLARDSSTRHNKGLAEAICSVLGSTLSLERSSSASGGMDYDSFRSASELQWRRFYRLIELLDKQRGEALSLSYEPGSGLSWIVCADSLSSLRECSRLEQICHNSATRHEGFEDASLLISTGLNFVDSFSDSMLQICNSVLRSEIFESSTKTEDERIQYFSDKAAFWRQTSDEDCAQVTDALGQNFSLISLDLYQRTTGLMKATEDSQREHKYPLTDFGRKLAVKATQEMVELQWNVCFSQLILLVHMEFEFDSPEDALHNRLDIGTVYRYLVTCLQRLSLVRWLVKTQLQLPLQSVEKPDHAASMSPATSKRHPEEMQTITAFEGLAGHLLGTAAIGAIPAALTSIATNLLAENSDTSLLPQYFQCAFLMWNRPDLAAEISPYAERDPFSTYVQGRVHLGLKDFTTAATYFKKAAYGLSRAIKNPDKHSSGLLNDTEWRLFYCGMPQYYAHIISLFEKVRAYSYVVEFAGLALQFVNHTTKDAASIRTEIQSRLFNGAVNISHFDLAHTTLVAMTNHALQRSLLRTLIEKMCDGLHNAELVKLPFPNLENSVDDILAQRCRDTTDIITDKPWHQILYSWRIKRNDYRGAAAILLDRINKLRQRADADDVLSDDVLDTVVTRQYLMLINTLSCVDEKQAWITTEGDGGDGAKSGSLGGAGKRKVVTLADIRRRYQDELDRISAISGDQWPLVPMDGDEMDLEA